MSQPGSGGYFGAATGSPSAPGRMLAVESLPQLSLASGILARALVGSNLLVSFVRWEPNSEAPVHAHEEEQIFILLEGELEMTLGDQTRRLGPGEAAHIPAWVPHGVRSFDGPAYQVDVFNPPRKAFLELLAAKDAEPAG